MATVLRRFAPLALAGLLTACAAAPGGPPRTTDPNWISNREPESPNSLPRGGLTNRPFPPATGVLSTTTGVLGTTRTQP